MSSIFERDFLLRSIKQFVELLARALKLGSAQKKDEAIQVLEAGCLSILGIDYRELTFVDSSSAANLLGSAHKILLFAKLLDGMRQVAEAAGDEASARSKAQYACEITLELLKRYPNNEEAAGLLQTLAPKLDAQLLPERYRAQFDKATALSALH